MEMTTRKVSDDKPKTSAAATEKSDEHKHVHPQGFRDVIVGQDDTGRRIVHTIPDRTPKYLHNCKACQAEDRARMKEPPSVLNLEQTLFLVPEPEYDGQVARAYLERRYQGEARNVVSAFNAEKLAYVKGSQVVVVTRRGKDGRSTGPRTRRTRDEEGTFHDAPIPPETYLEEIVESEPITVSDCIAMTEATMFSDASVDFSELVARLAERAVPFRIAPPADPKDRMYVMRLNT